MLRPRLLGALALACAALPAQAQTPCTDGSAGSYSCDGISLQAVVGITALGFPGAEGNDIWGWTDPNTDREYALMGTTSGISFVDVTSPAAPRVLGRLPTRTSNSLWRDVKTVGNYAYVVSEAGGHGIQIFDLTRLRNASSPPRVLSADAVYTGFGNAHNIVALPERNLVIGVGTGTCNGGLHMVDVSDPLTPTFAGCGSEAGYAHDAQCVVYSGPDPDYQGRDLCIGSNGRNQEGDQYSVTDITDRQNPVLVSLFIHPNAGYAHQGWFTEDQRYFIANDEGDENGSSPTRTLVFDLSDLDAPIYVGKYDGATPSIDHNLYVRGNLVFEANYRSGLRVLEIGNLAFAQLTEVAFFDTFPGSNSASFNGAWSVYPYFPSGTIIVSDIERGLFVLRVDGFNPLSAEGPDTPATLGLAVFPNPTAGPAQLRLTGLGAGSVTVDVYDVLGRRVSALHDGPAPSDVLALQIGALPAGTYLVRARRRGLRAHRALHRCTVIA